MLVDGLAGRYSGYSSTASLSILFVLQRCLQLHVFRHATSIHK